LSLGPNCSGMVNKHFLLEFFSFQVGSHYVAHVSLKLKILPPQPPECWDYRHAPSCLASLFFFFFFFFGAVMLDWTQSLECVRQVLYHSATSSSSFPLGF
jgi:hypothetical protein